MKATLSNEIEGFVQNTLNGNVYVIVKGIKRDICTTNSGKYGFISKNKILDEWAFIGNIKKLKYINIFNEESQKKIEDFINK